ncbi:DUF4129 domain-containing protein [Hymenobacter persicinus]|uniref:DUF4129 domain-containing protein n=1 Tax=Hymenobacter persicinus TaxID=2025506 RepID=A0A4Q5L8K4_9BACT|nr:DUF4129 domain-containing protein [Hymenobacter persicinus]RYU78003.1 DUF4129 domain-containing protein [Hymenobacter persicinus]
MRASTSRPLAASLLALLLTAAAPAVSGAGDSARRVELPADRTTPVRLREPAAGRLRAFRQQSEFQYVEPVPAETSAWSRFWRRFWQWLGELLSGPGYRTRGRYVVYAAFGVAFLMVLLRVLRLDFTNALGRTARPLPLAYEAAAEDIHAIDFPARLQEAEEAGNYRLAVRLGYLHVLHTLTTRHLIDWQPDKTNHEYLRELASTPWQDAFATLTRQFEYVWYGELALTARSYAQVRETRQQFLAALTSRAA